MMMSARIVRLLLPVICLVALAAAAVAGPAPGLQTAAPTGVVVVRLAPGHDDADLARVSALADTRPTPRIDPSLLAMAAAKSARASAALDALARYVQFDHAGMDRDQLLALVRRLAADPAVEHAFLEPRAVPAALGFDAFTGAGPDMATGIDPALPTPDFTEWQGYMSDAPMGIGAWSAWAQPGARGGAVKIIDVEGGWLWSHEDLPAPFAEIGAQIDDLGWRNHGTAVMGEMVGVDNPYGITGIVPDATGGNSSIGDQSVSQALLAAAAQLEAGDLVLIELHAPGPNANGSGQYGYVPMEWWQDNFDAIRALTDMGIIVVEAAGNGEQDLDDPVYLGLFDRSVRDSGAIMVGATSGSSLTPAWFTNHGARVDLAGWGANVATCGYGDLQGGAETEWYTLGFSGTSSASPIITGAVASLQGMVEAAYGFRMDASVARTILEQTGTPTGGPQLIGPRPDLVAAWELAAAGLGAVTGTVTEAGTGALLEGVAITVLPDGPTVYTGADGAYSLGLLTGTYVLLATSYLHADLGSQVVVGVGVTIHDLVMTALPSETIAGTVVDASLAPVGGAVLSLLGEPVPDVVSGADGSFAFSPVPQGATHRLLTGGAPGHGGAYDEFTGAAPLTVRLPATDYNFELGSQGFFDPYSLWQRGTPNASAWPGGAFDGLTCWGVGLGGGYGDNAWGELTSPTFQPGDFSGERLYLSFHYWRATEGAWDGVNVVLDPGAADELIAPVDGYTDQMLDGLGGQAGWSGHGDGWQTAVFDISSRLGAAWNFAVRFGSDGYVTDNGFLLDGVSIEAVDLTVAVGDDGVPAPGVVALAAWPNPFNPRVNVAWSLPAPGRLDLAVYDLRGRLVSRLVDGDAPAEGHVAWNGADAAGRALPSGVYLVQARPADGPVTTRRITLAR